MLSERSSQAGDTMLKPVHMQAAVKHVGSDQSCLPADAGYFLEMSGCSCESKIQVDTQDGMFKPCQHWQPTPDLQKLSRHDVILPMSAADKIMAYNIMTGCGLTCSCML